MRNLTDKIRKRLFQDPELRAMQIYEFITEQPVNVRKYLQEYLKDRPIYKDVKEDDDIKNNHSLRYHEEIILLDDQD